MKGVELSRRALIGGGAAFGGLLLSGCDRLSASPTFRQILSGAEPLSMGSQRLLLSGGQLAREFKSSDLSPVFRANGSTSVSDPAYLQMLETDFADYRLKVGGLVARPLSLSLDDLRRAPQRTQITRHDCVEGWSAIGQWTGTPLAGVLKAAGLHPNARYVVFHCADTMDQGNPLEGGGDDAETDEAAPAGNANPAMTKQSGGGESRKDSGGQQASDESAASAGSPVRYYESIDLVDAVHPQTILAYNMNGQALPVSNGAPLRLRVERNLGYKQAKYVMRIEVVESFAHLGEGKGGYWEDQGYAWYAGI